jgi:DNA-binding transcriptional ArsR family regulator
VISQDRQLGNLNEQLALVISHEITVKVLTILSDCAASPKEIAAKLGLKTPTVSHHVKKLERLGLVELIEEREVGGAIQHIYRAVIRPIVSDEDWDKLSIEERQLYSIWIVQLILADAAKSFDAALFDAYSNNHLSRTPLVVDEEGLAEVAEIQNRALRDIIQVLARSTERRVQSGEGGINLIAAMMCFPVPEPSNEPSLRTNL